MILRDRILKNRKLKALVRRWLPQGIRDALNRLFGYAIYFQGEFEDWQSAKHASSGYHDDQLVKRLCSAAIEVRDGNAAWEQDGQIWDHITSDMPIFAAMARVALSRGGGISVLDFGGGLGSGYFQCRAFFPDSKLRSWAVVEQPRLANFGREEISRDALRFFRSIEDALAWKDADVALFSGVLQYLEDPWEILNCIINSAIPYLIIDRHPCTITREMITVQVIPSSMYSASYPSWLFDCPRMLERLGEHYDLLAAWDGKDPAIRGWGIGAEFRGYFFKRHGVP